ncbi:4-hydroxythreonine-4-phosphate dehydrogenase PdxA [Synechococcus sp. RSCCF101]|uniref:4-hydroxythreonine-4-phosphate dehydrogenase PdxA n=1 Tax=Synechococcus sp. RSCCF101 TaxID=2511069 RepID=UPI002105B721|nr:4-hydroxythreonine-4-phosphate dehydrogenase PdxA [Synechococcus sp. RSCCF101]
MGDPAGIGPEVVLRALATGLPDGWEPVVVGCRRTLIRCREHLANQGVRDLADPAGLEMADMPLSGSVAAGAPSAISGNAGFRWLSAAAGLVLDGRCQALATAPIAKEYWHAAGHAYPGQTERLAELCGGAAVSMLFTARSPSGRWRLNTLLATTHIPLAAVPETLTPELLHRKLDALDGFCRRFRSHPRLVVAGLNPHAGEAGLLGHEERDWLTAALTAWQSSHPHTRLEGPRPPDTCWLDAAGAWHGAEDGPDGYLALYHDQGLIPVKLLAFDAAVNTTLGLPFVRTSPDHGTGFDIAGRGIARDASMRAAIETAVELCVRPAGPA